MTSESPVTIIGAGLAGSEAALKLASFGIRVRLIEMKPAERTAAAVSDGFAELVCSNSFRSSSLSNAVGVIKEEMRLLDGSLIRFADASSVPAGDALAVDRDKFSALVTEAVRARAEIEVVEGVQSELPNEGDVIVATGPLTPDALARAITEATGESSKLYFYDAIAPIVSADSIDMSKVYAASRYNKGGGDDYLNCPMDEAQYQSFIDAVNEAEKVGAHDFEEAKFFEGCLPIEVIAERGRDAPRFGCMKPVGLPHPETGKDPHAVVQLRTENRDKTAFNLVGFQTRMKWGDQTRVLRMIPGLEKAEFLRLGQVHRNTYLDSPSLLDDELRLKARPNIRFAGQITGVEGYVESTASGLLVALMIAARRLYDKPLPIPPQTTALGALYGHTLGKSRSDEGKKHAHVPSNIHWGMVPPLGVRAKKRDRKQMMGERALVDIKAYRAELDAFFQQFDAKVSGL